MKPQIRHCLILAAVTIAVWMSGAFGEFVWIDHVEIEQAGYRVNSWEDLRLVWTTSLDGYLERKTGKLEAEGGYFRPVYAMLISADWLLWGDQPFAFHLTNILVHTLVVIGLYCLGRQILPAPEQAGVVFFATMLFAVHPFGVHSVTWISGRKDSLCALFAILSLIGFGKLLNASGSGRSGLKKTIIVVCSVASLNIGLLCKELAIVTPAFATLWIWWASNSESDRPEQNSLDSNQHSIGTASIVLLVLFWMTSIGAIAYRRILLGGIGLNIGYPADSLVGNFSVSCKLICWYAVRIVFPIDPTIVDRWRIGDSLEPVSRIAMLVVVTTLVFLIVKLARRKTSGLLLSWFFIWLLPATGLVPLRHMYAERYLYPASWGLLIAIIYVSQPWFDRVFKQKLAFYVVVSIAVVLFSFLTFKSNQHWNSDQELFAHAIAQDEFYAEGLSALALIELENRNYQQTIQFGERAIESANDPNYRSYWSPFGVYTNTGLAAYYLGDFDRALSLLQKAKTFRPDNAISSYHLGLVSETKNLPDEAIRHYESAISINPDDHGSRVNLGHVLLRQQRFEDCILILGPTVTSQPEDRMAQVNIATAYLLSKDFPAAELHFEAAIKIDSNDPINLAKLAWSEFEQGKTEEGKSHLESAKQKLPNNPTVRFVEQKYLNR